MSETILEEAQRLVHGDRQNAYGHPYDDFSRTGRIWGAILGIEDVPPHLVALCLIGVKVSRETNAPKRDNRTDIAGYAETLDLVRQREEELEQIYADAQVPPSIPRDSCGSASYDYDDSGGHLITVCFLPIGHVGPHDFEESLEQPE